ncbi:MAG: DUF1707 domain-containing protein [Geodermatophilaceae bacterium]
MTTPETPDRRAEPATHPAVRIGDREREQAVAQLGRAFAEGRLDLDEYDQRVASAYGAKKASDLLHLTADLPVANPERPESSGQHISPAMGRGRRARALTDEPSWLWRLWGTYASVVTLCVVIWLIVGLIGKGGFSYPWPLWVAGPWGALLLVQTLGASPVRRGSADSGSARDS